MSVNEKENLESLAREYLKNSGNDYLTILSDMRKKGHDEETTMKVFERYEELRAQKLDDKTIQINEKEKKRLQHSDLKETYALIIGLICFVIAFINSSSIWAIAVLLVGSSVIGYLLNKRKPLALIIGFFVFFMLISTTTDMYFEGRTTYLKIEGAIPVLLAAIPACALYFGIQKMSK